MHIALVTTTSASTATPAHHRVWLLPFTMPRRYTPPVVGAIANVPGGSPPGVCGAAGGGANTTASPHAEAVALMNPQYGASARCRLTELRAHCELGEDIDDSSFTATRAPSADTMPPPLSPWQMAAGPCARHTQPARGSMVLAMAPHAYADSGCVENSWRLWSPPVAPPAGMPYPKTVTSPAGGNPMGRAPAMAPLTRRSAMSAAPGASAVPTTA